jgi:hypothetical protein
MGQDTSCGICGKHYQNCKHFIKEHALNPKTNKTFCGKDPKKVVASSTDIKSGSWFLESVDPDDLCIKCKKITNYDEVMRKLYEEDNDFVMFLED